ncbi:unnamed protein product [Miscanthus lutarioriparius]|uniref:Uncharacterized protein n=1 Tax=Miscanthus lutarioriparius TaxID=422564 RepID=A0A811M7V7_9POAL|nr:unnamed protein product [Miscanthus lutarioriparius]
MPGEYSTLVGVGPVGVKGPLEAACELPEGVKAAVQLHQDRLSTAASSRSVGRALVLTGWARTHMCRCPLAGTSSAPSPEPLVFSKLISTTKKTRMYRFRPANHRLAALIAPAKQPAPRASPRHDLGTAARARLPPTPPLRASQSGASGRPRRTKAVPSRELFCSSRSPRRAGSCSSFPLAHAPSGVLDTALIHCGGARSGGRKVCHRPVSSISAHAAAIGRESTRPASSRTAATAAPRPPPLLGPRAALPTSNMGVDSCRGGRRKRSSAGERAGR